MWVTRLGPHWGWHWEVHWDWQKVLQMGQLRACRWVCLRALLMAKMKVPHWEWLKAGQKGRQMGWSLGLQRELPKAQSLGWSLGLQRDLLKAQSLGLQKGLHLG